jgi:Uncharacterised nucleotidyltransferase
MGPRADQAAYVLRMHALQRLDRALGDQGLDALLVKGAALALTHYAEPWTRTMGDIDVIVRPGSLEPTVAALRQRGFVVGTNAERPLTASFFGETAVTLPCGVTSVLVELHTRLDKVVARPVDHAAIFARASLAPSLPHLWVPAGEDHVLLLALHAAGHDFCHGPARADVEHVLAAGVDEEVLIRRAREWRLATVLFVMLSLLREGGSRRVSDRLLGAVEPRGLRRFLVERYRSRVAEPALSPSLGWPWIGRQTVLRDDLSAWVRGVTVYAAARAAEVALAGRGRG